VAFGTLKVYVLAAMDPMDKIEPGDRDCSLSLALDSDLASSVLRDRRNQWFLYSLWDSLIRDTR
jgi:hypothetical protein